MKKSFLITLGVPLFVQVIQAQSVVIAPAGDGSGYDLEGATVDSEAAAFRSTSVLKRYDGDADNIYGTEGYFFYGNGANANSNSNGKPSWIASMQSKVTATASYPGYTLFDDPTATAGANVVDWAQSSIGDVNTSGTTGGLWAGLFDFTVDADAPRSFRVGVMTGTEATSDGRWDPVALRLSVDGSSPVTVSSLPVTDLGMVFFDIILAEGGGGTFTLEGQTRALGANTRGPSIAGLTFDLCMLQPTAVIEGDLKVDGVLRVDGGLDLVGNGLAVYTDHDSYESGGAPSLVIDAEGNLSAPLPQGDLSMGVFTD